MLAWGRESVTSVLEPVWTCLWREVGTGFGRGSRPRQRSCLCMCLIVPIHRGRSKAAWSKLHYQEYLGERISVNPNRYKDFCFRFVMDLLENFASSVLVFRFWFLFLKPHCLSLFFLCFWPSFLSHPNSSVTIDDLTGENKFWFNVKWSSWKWNDSWNSRYLSYIKLYPKNY